MATNNDHKSFEHFITFVTNTLDDTEIKNYDKNLFIKNITNPKFYKKNNKYSPYLGLYIVNKYVENHPTNPDMKNVLVHDVYQELKQNQVVYQTLSNINYNNWRIFEEIDQNGIVTEIQKTNIFDIIDLDYFMDKKSYDYMSYSNGSINDEEEKASESIKAYFTPDLKTQSNPSSFFNTIFSGGNDNTFDAKPPSIWPTDWESQTFDTDVLYQCILRNDDKKLQSCINSMNVSKIKSKIIDSMQTMPINFKINLLKALDVRVLQSGRNFKIEKYENWVKRNMLTVFLNGYQFYQYPEFNKNLQTQITSLDALKTYIKNRIFGLNSIQTLNEQIDQNIAKTLKSNLGKNNVILSENEFNTEILKDAANSKNNLIKSHITNTILKDATTQQTNQNNQQVTIIVDLAKVQENVNKVMPLIKKDLKYLEPFISTDSSSGEDKFNLMNTFEILSYIAHVCIDSVMANNYQKAREFYNDYERQQHKEMYSHIKPGTSTNMANIITSNGSVSIPYSHSLNYSSTPIIMNPVRPNSNFMQSFYREGSCYLTGGSMNNSELLKNKFNSIVNQLQLKNYILKKGDKEAIDRAFDKLAFYEDRINTLVQKFNNYNMSIKAKNSDVQMYDWDTVEKVKIEDINRLSEKYDAYEQFILASIQQLQKHLEKYTKRPVSM